MNIWSARATIYEGSAICCICAMWLTAPALWLSIGIVLHAGDDTPAQKRHALLDDFYRRELKDAVRPIIARWEKELDVRVGRFFVQRMKTKWGSSNPRLRTIRLNLDLAKKPAECAD